MGLDAIPDALVRLPLKNTETTLPARREARRNHVLAAASLLLLAAVSSVVAALTSSIALLIVACVSSLAAPLIVARRRRGPVVAPTSPSESALLVDASGVTLIVERDRAERLVSFQPSFGICVLASAARSGLVVAITSSARTVCIGADFTPAEWRRFDMLLPHAVTVTANELAMATLLPTGERLQVESTSLLHLIELLLRLDPSAMERCILSDNEGRSIVLERDRLATPRCTFRLDQPFEWRALRFLETAGTMDAVFQGTWIRQGKDEVVLVCLLADDVRSSIHDVAALGLGSPDAFLLQDARLADGVVVPPPPRDRRIAVDRLFMLPVRRALDRAHRDEKRDSIPGGATVA